MSGTTETVAAGAAELRAPHVRRWPAYLVATGAYLALSLWIMSNVVSTSVTRASTCACNDNSLFAWFFQWPLTALRSGQNPFYSTAMFHPQGVNLLSNTSVTLLSFVLMPVTAAFGPIASVNVALIAAPVLSGLAAMWVTLRWVRSAGAAFVAGALYGFSPIVLFESAGAHLMVSFLVVPPLLLACVDELLWRRRHPPVRVGVALGALIVAQFFLGTELLVILAITTAVCLCVLGGYGVVTDRSGAWSAMRRAGPGIAVAVGIAVVVLAWPTYYALYGPGHYVGPVWPGVGETDESLKSFVVAQRGTALWWIPRAPRIVRFTYMGPTLVATLVVGGVVWRRSRRLLAAITMTALIAWFALGAHYGFSPWHYLRSIGLLVNVMNDRFAALLFLPAGIALAIILDKVRALRRGALGAGLAIALAALCVAPLARNMQVALPYKASTVWEPQWYSRADALPSGQVVLGFPFFDASADLLSVQALHKMHYSIVGGTGPSWLDSRQPPATQPGYRLVKGLAAWTLDPFLAPTASTAQAAALRTALRVWGTTYVVVPMRRGPNTSWVGRSPQFEANWLTSALGAPRIEHGAWVWHRGDPRNWLLVQPSR